MVVGATGGVEEIRRRDSPSSGRRRPPGRAAAAPGPSASSPSRDVPPRIWNAATVRFPEVTRADPAELELDQVRQLANAHYAGEHNR
jgi:hypothetical protein